MKTSELTGAALDWAVAKCEGVSFVWLGTDFTPDGRTFQRGTAQAAGPHYSTNWSQGGPIIHRERITVHDFDGLWIASVFDRTSFGSPKKREIPGKDVFGKYVVLHHEFGITPLEAAMRCHVASKLGDNIDIPEELK